MRVQDIQVNDTVVFETVPNGSYLSSGIIYRVEAICEREIHFRRATGECGTSESKGMLACKGVSFYRATC